MNQEKLFYLLAKRASHVKELHEGLMQLMLKSVASQNHIDDVDMTDSELYQSLTELIDKRQIEPEFLQIVENVKKYFEEQLTDSRASEVSFHDSYLKPLEFKRPDDFLPDEKLLVNVRSLNAIWAIPKFSIPDTKAKIEATLFERLDQFRGCFQDCLTRENSELQFEIKKKYLLARPFDFFKKGLKTDIDYLKVRLKKSLEELVFSPICPCPEIEDLNQIKSENQFLFFSALSELLLEFKDEIVLYLVFSNDCSCYDFLIKNNIDIQSSDLVGGFFREKYSDLNEVDPIQIISQLLINLHYSPVPDNILKFCKEFPVTAFLLYLEDRSALTDIEQKVIHDLSASEISEINLESFLKSIEPPIYEEVIIKNFFNSKNQHDSKSEGLGLPNHRESDEESKLSSHSIIEEGLEEVVDEVLFGGSGLLNVEKLPLAEIALNEPRQDKKPKLRKIREGSVWLKHLQPMIKENLFPFVCTLGIFLGILSLMVALWDKAAWVRCGLAPLTILGLGFGLSKMASWLIKIDPKSKIPSLVLHIASLSLSPLCFVMLSNSKAGDWEIYLVPFLLVGFSVAWWKIFSIGMRELCPDLVKRFKVDLVIVHSLLFMLPISRFFHSGLLDGHPNDLFFLIGFYFISLVVIWRLTKIASFYKLDDVNQNLMAQCYYIVSVCLAFIIVWGVMHIRLHALPSAAYYSILITYIAFLFFYIEFNMVGSLQNNKINLRGVSCLGSAFIILGCVLSVFNDWMRPVTFVVASIIWFYQSSKRNDERHYIISLCILITGVSSIAFQDFFEAWMFPALVFVQSFSLLLCSSKNKVLTSACDSIFFAFTSMGVLLSFVWQWHSNQNNLVFGIGIFFLGLITIIKGSRNKNFGHTHSGLSYVLLVTPFLGFANIEEKIFLGNTLVSGISIIGFFWLVISSQKKFEFLNKCRSSGLMSIALCGFAILTTNFLCEFNSFEGDLLHFYSVLVGPLLLGTLFLIIGILTHSQIPVFLCLITFVIIFPEIKQQYNIQMYTGMGSSISALCMVVLSFIFSRWGKLNRLGEKDLIFDKYTFPLNRSGHKLLSNPILIAALFLIGRTLFKTYPHNFYVDLVSGERPFERKTLVAVFISSMCLYYYAEWFKNRLFSFLSSSVLLVLSVHMAYFISSDFKYVSLFLLAYLILNEFIQVLVKRIKVDSEGENILKPVRKVTSVVVVALGVLLYLLSVGFSTNYLYLLPLCVYLCIYSFSLYKKEMRFAMIFTLYISLWQTFILVTMGGASYSELIDYNSNIDLFTFVYQIFVLIAFVCLERKLSDTLYQNAGRILYLSLGMFIFFAVPNSLAFINNEAVLFAMSNENSFFIFGLIAITFILYGRQFNNSILILLGVISCYPLLLQLLSYINGTLLNDRLPFDGVCLFVVFSTLFVALLNKFSFLCRSQKKLEFVSLEELDSRVLVTSFSNILKWLLICFCISNYRGLNANDLLWLYALAVVSFYDAKFLKANRNFYFGLIFAIVNSLGAIYLHKKNSLFGLSHTFGLNHVISIGLIMSLGFSVIMDRFRRVDDATYGYLKLGLAAMISLLVFVPYCISRDVNISWENLLASFFLTSCAGLYSRYLIPNIDKSKMYGLFVFNATIAIFCFGLLLIEYVFKMRVTIVVAFILLSIAPFWFYFRSEFRFAKDELFQDSRNAAQILLTILISFYLHQNLFEFFFLPSEQIGIEHYYLNSFVIFFASVFMIRISRMGGLVYIPYLGAMTLMSSLYFMVGNIPSLQIPLHVANAGYLAIFVSFVLFIFSDLKIVKSEIINVLFGVKENDWNEIRKTFFALGLVGTHVISLLLLIKTNEASQFSFLLIGTSLLWAYIGHAYKKLSFIHVAFFEILVALILMPKIGKVTSLDVKLISLLCFFVGILFLHKSYLKKVFEGFNLNICVQVWSICIITCVCALQWQEYVDVKFLSYYPFPALWLITFFIPTNQNNENSFSKLFVSFLMVVAPAVYISALIGWKQPLFYSFGFTFLSSLCFLLGLLESDFVENVKIKLKNQNIFFSQIVNCLFHSDGRLVLVIMSLCSLGSVMLTGYLHEFPSTSLVHCLLIACQMEIAYFWYKRALIKNNLLISFVALFFYSSFYMNIRLAFVLVSGVKWAPEFDIYLFMGKAFLITSLQPLLEKQSSCIQIPIKYSLLGLPLLSLAICFGFDVSEDLRIHMILFYSVIFSWKSYSEKDRFVLAYACFGFNAYLIMWFFKQDVQSIQAYVIPVCVTILVYVQIFRKNTPHGTANVIRTCALLVLLGSSGWEIFHHHMKSPMHHVILLFLSILCIYLSTFLKLKTYGVVGIFFFVLDVIAIIYLIVKDQNANTIKITLGLLLTIGGGISLWGYLYYRNHKESIDAKMNRFMKKLKSWE